MAFAWLARENSCGGHNLTNILTCFLLAAALSLSVRRFLVPYIRADGRAEATSPLTMVASAVFLTALALTIADTDVLRAALTLASGLLFAVLLDGLRPTLLVALSVACLIAYLGLR
ncbi:MULTISPECIES: hypothetical protein [unclassified Neorhizobium]|uniref:hypothetical protein n=1 Tax=unclassified Neorhizobium TaxID=2629175 RepID=UPI000CF8B36C|nr:MULTISPECIES: hypothetical protein [unclassified Neorhizobium]